MKLVVSLVPIFIVAAMFESYVTRYTNMPVWLSISILTGSLAFMLWYFVYLPIRVTKLHGVEHEQ